MTKAMPANANPTHHIAVFQEKTIRRTWHNEEWWFSVVDDRAILTESPDAGASTGANSNSGSTPKAANL